uniref:Lipoprotein n=1 Tax=Cyprinodon variegatus TaxID=28743 RepID=A0A3Q2GQF5_CYPVA
MKTVLLASALLLGLFGCSVALPLPVPFPYPDPYQAVCGTMWLFATPCAEISTTVAKQIQALSPEYMLISATPLAIKANHTSPDGISVQDITFSLSPTIVTGGCRVSAKSSSLGFTGLLDGGLNYCNLHKLVSASGLTLSPGYMEMTNEWACLGYGMAKC